MAMPCAPCFPRTPPLSLWRTLWAWHAIVAPQKAKTTCKSGTCSVGIKWHVAASAAAATAAVAARTLIMMKKFHNTHWHTLAHTCTHTTLYTQFIYCLARCCRTLTSIKIALAARRQWQKATCQAKYMRVCVCESLFLPCPLPLCAGLLHKAHSFHLDDDSDSDWGWGSN